MRRSTRPAVITCLPALNSSTIIRTIGQVYHSTVILPACLPRMKHLTAQVWRACKTAGEMCNLLAMTYLQQEDFNMVLELLKKAEILTERDQACFATIPTQFY